MRLAKTAGQDSGQEIYTIRAIMLEITGPLSPEAERN